MPDFVDYDAYDARVFRSAAPKSSKKIPMRTVSSATAMTGRYGSSCEVEGCGRFGSRDEPASRKSWSSPPAHGSLGAVDGGLEARHVSAVAEEGRRPNWTMTTTIVMMIIRR